MAEVKTAQEATELVVSFLKTYYPSFAIRPLKARREDGSWHVEVDVGAFVTQVGSFAVDAATGEISAYDIPSIRESTKGSA